VVVVVVSSSKRRWDLWTLHVCVLHFGCSARVQVRVRAVRAASSDNPGEDMHSIHSESAKREAPPPPWCSCLNLAALCPSTCAINHVLVRPACSLVGLLGAQRRLYIRTQEQSIDCVWLAGSTRLALCLAVV
jgi:hypothetical protein